MCHPKRNFPLFYLGADDKRHIADIIAHFQDIVSMEHLQSLLMDADAQEAFLSVAESSR